MIIINIINNNKNDITNYTKEIIVQSVIIRIKGVTKKNASINSPVTDRSVLDCADFVHRVAPV
jgi:hypothetical protein